MQEILQINPAFHNPLYSDLNDKLEKLGYNFSVYYYQMKGSSEKVVEREYVKAAYPYRSIHRFFYLWKEHKILDAYYYLFGGKKFDLIHAQTLYSAGYIAYRINKKTGVKYIVSIRNTDVLFLKKRLFLRKLATNILLGAEKIIYISGNAQFEAEKYMSLKYRKQISGKSYIIPNGINDFWLNNMEKKIRVRDCEKRLTVLYYGDINSNKRITTVLKALDKLQEEGYNIKYSIIGKIREQAIFVEMKKRAYVEYKEFMPKERLREYLMKSDIFVMTSKSETFGLSYVEAMTCGVPVIYTKGQGFDSFFKSGVVGYPVDANSSMEVIEAIKKILSNYSLMSYNCLEQVRQFDWNKIAQKYCQVYGE